MHEQYIYIYIAVAKKRLRTSRFCSMPCSSLQKIGVVKPSTMMLTLWEFQGHGCHVFAGKDSVGGGPRPLKIPGIKRNWFFLKLQMTAAKWLHELWSFRGWLRFRKPWFNRIPMQDWVGFYPSYELDSQGFGLLLKWRRLLNPSIPVSARIPHWRLNRNRTTVDKAPQFWGNQIVSQHLA